MSVLALSKNTSGESPTRLARPAYGTIQVTAIIGCLVQEYRSS